MIPEFLLKILVNVLSLSLVHVQSTINGKIAFHFVCVHYRNDSLHAGIYFHIFFYDVSVFAAIIHYA